MCTMKKVKPNKIILLIFFCLGTTVYGSDGYDLWLRYNRISKDEIRTNYVATLKSVSVSSGSATMNIAKNELLKGLNGMLNSNYTILDTPDSSTSLVVAKKEDLSAEFQKLLEKEFTSTGNEGFILKTIQHKKNTHIIITGHEDVGVLYGVFNFLRLLQNHKSITQLNIMDSPKVNLRMLNHWDNLDPLPFYVPVKSRGSELFSRDSMN